jgi:gas vesicle protein
MIGNAAGKFLSGLVVGAAVGASVALVLSSRADVAVPSGAAVDGRRGTGPTPFEPANQLIARARVIVDEVRAQIQQAVAEGKATAAQTRQELTARFEAAKRGTDDQSKP